MPEKKKSPSLGAALAERIRGDGLPSQATIVPLTPAARARGESLGDQNRARAALAAYNRPAQPGLNLQSLFSPGRSELNLDDQARSHTLDGSPGNKDTAPVVRTRGLSTVGAVTGQQPLGAGVGFGPAAGLDTTRPAGGFLDHGDGSKTQILPPARMSLGQTIGARLRAPGEMGSAGVMTDRARQQALAQAASTPMPPALRSSVEQQILAGDYGAPGRAQQLLEQVSIPAGKEQTLGQILGAMIRGDDQAAKVAAKKAQDRATYAERARANTQLAQQSSQAAMDMGLNPLASGHEMRAHQEQEKRKAYMQADQATLERLAAQGDPVAAEALRGGTMPGFTGPVQGVRERTEATNKRVLDEAQQRALDLAHERFVVPKEIQADADQHVAQYAAQGRVDAATITAAAKNTGNSTDAAALKAWGVQMMERQKLGYPTIKLTEWAATNRVPLSPALMGQPSTVTSAGAGPAGGQGQAFNFGPAQQTQIQQLTPEALANLQDIIAAGPSNPDYAEAVAIMQARGGQ